MKESLSIVIPTRRDASLLAPLLHSLQHQTRQADEIIILIDRHFDDQQSYNAYCQQLSDIRDYPYTIISHISTPTFVPLQGVSYVRNIGINKSSSNLTMCIDDDNAMDSDFLWLLIKERTHLSQQYPKLALLAPTELKGHSHTILSQWFGWYDFWLARPHGTRIPSSQHHQNIQLVWSNCFLAQTAVLQQYGFDEEFPFVAEDLDMSYQLYQRGYTLITTANVNVHHLQRPKNTLQEAYVGDPDSAYQKGKNRILFAYKHGSFWQQRVFFTIGLPGNTIRLTGKILLFPQSRARRRSLIQSLWKGTRDGLRRYYPRHRSNKYTHPKSWHVSNASFDTSLTQKRQSQNRKAQHKHPQHKQHSHNYY